MVESVCGGHGGCQSPIHCFWHFLSFPRPLGFAQKRNFFLKFTAAKPFALAHFARYMEYARVPVSFRCCLYSLFSSHFARLKIIEQRMDSWMDGQMGRQTNRWTDGQTDIQMD